MKINDDLIDFLKKQHYAIISTLDKNGAIHNSCKGIVDIDKQGIICLLDLYKQRTYANLQLNPNISLTVVDEHQFQGYSLKGKARMISGEKITEDMMKAWEKKVTSRVSQRILRNIKGKKGHPKHPEILFPMPEYAIEMTVDSVVDLTPHALK
ncbi:MAG: pyridoxamine 5'-phosphate oxidase family protein [Candidatus Orphnella occulta]|nr:pyridoxamine 5'-phosphate oxidase family protein [Candidatus Orphnella occulta]